MVFQCVLGWGCFRTLFPFPIIAWNCFDLAEVWHTYLKHYWLLCKSSTSTCHHFDFLFHGNTCRIKSQLQWKAMGPLRVLPLVFLSELIKSVVMACLWRRDLHFRLNSCKLLRPFLYEHKNKEYNCEEYLKRMQYIWLTIKIRTLPIQLFEPYWRYVAEVVAGRSWENVWLIAGGINTSGKMGWACAGLHDGLPL